MKGDYNGDGDDDSNGDVGDTICKPLMPVIELPRIVQEGKSA